MCFGSENDPTPITTAANWKNGCFERFQLYDLEFFVRKTQNDFEPKSMFSKSKFACIYAVENSVVFEIRHYSTSRSAVRLPPPNG